jgi:hypothetical protein
MGKVSQLDGQVDAYAFESRAIRMASTKGMSTGESNNLLIRETHSVKDVADVSGSLGAIGETTIGGTCGHVLVGTTGSPGDGGTAHFLAGTDTSKGPEIGVGDPGELGLDGFEMVAGDYETGIGTVVTFRGKTLQRQSQNQVGGRTSGDLPW